MGGDMNLSFIKTPNLLAATLPYRFPLGRFRIQEYHPRAKLGRFAPHSIWLCLAGAYWEF